MWNRLACAALLGLAGTSLGCNTAPIKDERINRVLSACCEAARGRVELAADVETDKFRNRCGACRVGKQTGECEAAARRVQGAVSKAYASETWPMECSTLREQLGELGVSIPKLP
jgi:hypothetical protein